MKKTILTLLLICLIALTGCNQESKDGGDKDIYAAIVRINDKQYNGATVDNEANKEAYKGIEIGEQIGTITKKIDKKKIPNANMQSNYYNPKTKIYAVKGTDEYIIMIDKNNKKFLAEKALE